MSLMSQYYVFLDVIPLPVTPEKIEISVPNLNKTVTMVDQGEVNILRGKGLKDIKFDMLIPSYNYPFANYSFGSFSTSQIIARLEYLKETGQPVFFIVTRCRRGIPAWWTNIKVSLEDFTVTEDANNGTDVIISVNLKEYREYSTKLAKVTENKDGSVTAKFENPRNITGSIAPTFRLDKLSTDVTTITIEPNSTLYNEVKTKLGTVDDKVTNAIKKLNDMKNTVAAKTKVKLPPECVGGKVDYNGMLFPYKTKVDNIIKSQLPYNDVFDRLNSLSR